MSFFRNAGKGVKKAADKVAPTISGKALLFGATVDSYSYYKRGHSKLSSIGRGLAETAVWELAPGVIGAYVGGMAIGGAAKGIRSLDDSMNERHKLRTSTGPNFNGFKDTRSSQTMRQAAVRAIQGSQLNARQGLGGEASFMHTIDQSL